MLYNQCFMQDMSKSIIAYIHLYMYVSMYMHVHGIICMYIIIILCMYNGDVHVHACHPVFLLYKSVLDTAQIYDVFIHRMHDSGSSDQDSEVPAYWTQHRFLNTYSSCCNMILIIISWLPAVLSVMWMKHLPAVYHQCNHTTGGCMGVYYSSYITLIGMHELHGRMHPQLR